MDIRRTVVVLDEPSWSQDRIKRLFAGHAQWQIVVAGDFNEARQALLRYSDPMVIIPAGMYDANLERIVLGVHETSLKSPVIYLARNVGSGEMATRALRAGINDVVFDAMLEDSANLESLALAWIRQEVAAQAGNVSRQLIKCKDNMELLDELSAAVTSTINHDELLHRALSVFASICPDGRASYCELFVAPDSMGNGESIPPASAMMLRCVGKSSQPAMKAQREDRSPSDLSSTQRAHEQELIKLILADEIKINILAPGEKYPRLREVWPDLDGEMMSLIPVWSSGQALGLLTICSRMDGQCSRLFQGDEPLRAMARVFGSMLQNAQLYEEVDAAYQTLQRTQSQLVHSEKFAAMGVLSAEIAHEFNNPASFVISNLSVMREYVEMISGFVEGLGKLRHGDSSTAAEIKALEERYEIAFLREDLDNLIARSLSGMQRIHQIVQDLRYFSHDVAQEPGWVDLEKLVSAVLHLVNHESRFRAQLELDFCGLPQVFSDANKLSQVLLNLFVNAAQSIAPGNPDENFIRVRTRRQGDDVVLSVQDSGAGIPGDVLPRIFEPFFTTKERGSATGLGLPIVQDILRSLGGELTVSSKPGVGSLFEFQLPVRAAQFAVKKELRESGSYKTPPRLRRNTPVYRTIDPPPDEKPNHREDPK